MTKILITGGAGFVGTHFIEHVLKNTDWRIVTLDRFDAAGNPNRLSDMMETTPGIDRARVKFVFWDLKSALNGQVCKQLGEPFDHIVHLAAGSHVDRSIVDPMGFFLDNCIGTINLLLYARDGGLRYEQSNGKGNHGAPDGKPGKFLYFSTDEVFGPYPLDGEGGYREWDRHNPNNPYAASKSAGEMACISFAHTYRMPIVISNTMNIFGERQAPEKFVPLIMRSVLSGEKLYVHATADKTQAGKRHYLHARNISAAIISILQNGKTLDGSGKRGRYNVVGEVELDNLSLAKLVASTVQDWQHAHGMDVTDLNYELVDFHSSRPGHDLRYSLDGSLLEEEGFSYPVSFEESLRRMVYWTLDRREKWL